MHAFAIVTFTLTGLAGLLFGSDYLDRRLLVRSGSWVPEPGPATDPAPADAEAEVTVTAGGVPVDGLGTAASAAPVLHGPVSISRTARPASGCRHGCDGRQARTAHARIAGGHGPLAVTPDRRPVA